MSNLPYHAGDTLEPTCGCRMPPPPDVIRRGHEDLERMERWLRTHVARGQLLDTALDAVVGGVLAAMHKLPKEE